MVDALPLSCLQTRGTIPYLLEQVRFRVVHTGWLERVNQTFGSTQTSPRYLVVASKPGELAEGPQIT
jgi:hypothetical protein